VDAGGESTYQERTNFRLVQTPQTFQLKPLLQAFAVEELEIFTDDATVYEYQGWTVSLIEGNSENIKLTPPEDLVFAEFLMATR
jgi:2-C-methyl-D-erythritol 4-phosphate cytidylyltransferase